MGLASAVTSTPRHPRSLDYLRPLAATCGPWASHDRCPARSPRHLDEPSPRGRRQTTGLGWRRGRAWPRAPGAGLASTGGLAPAPGIGPAHPRGLAPAPGIGPAHPGGLAPAPGIGPAHARSPLWYQQQRLGAPPGPGYAARVSFLEELRDFLRHPVIFPAEAIREYRRHFLACSNVWNARGPMQRRWRMRSIRWGPSWNGS